MELAGPDCLFENTIRDTFLDFADWVSQKQSAVIEAKKKGGCSTSVRKNTEGRNGVVKARDPWTNLALPCVAGTQSFEKPSKNRLMQVARDSCDGRHTQPHWGVVNKKKRGGGGRNADSLHTARSASARGYVTM